MPADDGLQGMPPEDLAAFLRDLRALREREGLSLNGLAMPGARSHGAGQHRLSITRIGPRLVPRLGSPRSRWRPNAGLIGITTVALVLAGLAAGGAVLTEPTGHSQVNAQAAPLPAAGGRSMAKHGGRMHTRTRAPARPSQQPAPSSPGPRARARVPRREHVRVVVPHLVRPAMPGAVVAGVGCPDRQGDGVILNPAATGPGWTDAGGGWTGNGCDGNSVWTMDPNGNQASPSTLTWFFQPAPRASACRLDVFIPTENALGTASYLITDGSVSLGDVSIDQAGMTGQWVTLGTYPVTAGTVPESTLDVQVAPGTASLADATITGSGTSGSGNGGGNGNSQGGGNGGDGNGTSASASPSPSPSPSPSTGHNAAVAASTARAKCS